MDFRHDGVSIHYVTAGEGDPLLFLHGLGGRSENWSHQIASFSRTHQVVALDLPGHGRSDGREISFLDYWRWIEALLDHLQLESATLCGLSKGARAGLMLAARRPERVSRMIVLNAFLHLTTEDADRRRDLYDLLLLGDGGARWAEQLLDLMGVRDHPAIVRGFRRSLDSIEPLHIRMRFREMLGFDQRAELGDLRCRTLVVRGTNDGFIPAYCASDLLASVPCGWHASLAPGTCLILKTRQGSMPCLRASWPTAEQKLPLEVLLYRDRAIANGINRLLQSLAADTKFIGPILNLVILAHRDPRAILRRPLRFVVGHVSLHCSITQERTRFLTVSMHITRPGPLLV